MKTRKIRVGGYTLSNEESRVLSEALELFQRIGFGDIAAVGQEINSTAWNVPYQTTQNVIQCFENAHQILHGNAKSTWQIRQNKGIIQVDPEVSNAALVATGLLNRICGKIKAAKKVNEHLAARIKGKI